MTTIQYFTRDEYEGFSKGHVFVRNYLTEHDFCDVLEIGAGANPTIDLEYLRDKPQLNYTANDIDENELAKLDPRFRMLCADLTSPKLELTQKYDLIFSRNVNEHVRSGRDYYRNIFGILKPGGRSFHFFSTLYSLPFLANWIMPEFVSDLLLKFFAPRDQFKQGKFKAHYSWSRGPTRRMIARFESIGFEVQQYDGYFGHRYYRNRLPWLHSIEMAKARMLTRFPIPFLTSYAFLELRRPLA